MSECLFPNCRRHSEKNGFCIGHSAFAKLKMEPEEVKQISKKSETFKINDKEYRKLVIEFALKSKKCQIHSPVCTKLMEGLHHKKKRGEFLLDKRFLLRSCNACNDFLEANTDWGIEHGFILSKFNQHEKA